MSWGNSSPAKLYYRKTLGLWKAGSGYSHYFDPKALIARSGNHVDSFTFLKKVNGRLLLTWCPNTDYASSISKLLKGKHKVTWVDPECSLDLFKTEGLKSRFVELYQLEANLSKKGIRHTTKDWQKKEIETLKEEIRKLSKLGAGFPVKMRKLIQKKEIKRVQKENAEYDERRKRSRLEPKSPNSVTEFKKQLLANSWINVA